MIESFRTATKWTLWCSQLLLKGQETKNQEDNMSDRQQLLEVLRKNVYDSTTTGHLLMKTM